MSLPPLVGRTEDPNAPPLAASTLRAYFASKIDAAGGDLSAAVATATGAAVAASMAARLGRMLNLVDDFGADPTGTVSSLAAITSAANSGLPIFVPPGIFIQDGAAPALSAHQLWRGAGQLQTTIKISGSGFDAFTLTSDHASIENLAFDTTSGASRTSGANINLTSNTYGNRIRRVRMEHPFKGILISGNAVVTVIDTVDIRDICAGTGVGVHIQGGNDTYIKVLLTDNAASAQPYSGLWLQSTGGIFVCQADLIHSGIALNLQTLSSSDEVNFNSFVSVDTDTSTTGVSIQAAAGSKIFSNEFTQLWASSHTGRGVDIGGAGTVDGTTFIGGRFFNCRQQGFYCASSAINTKVLGATVSGNSVATPGTYAGMQFQGGTSKFDVIDCIVGPSGSIFADTQVAGILIDAGASTNYSVNDNNVLGNYGSGLIDGGTGTGVVERNRGYNPVGASAITVGASPFTFTSGHTSTTVYIAGGTVSAIAQGGITLFSGTNVTVHLGPNESCVVTYSAAPVMKKMVH